MAKVRRDSKKSLQRTMDVVGFQTYHSRHLERKAMECARQEAAGNVGHRQSIVRARLALKKSARMQSIREWMRRYVGGNTD